MKPELKDFDSIELYVEALNAYYANLESNHDEIKRKLSIKTKKLEALGDDDPVALRKAKDELEALKVKDKESNNQYKELLQDSRKNEETLKNEVESLKKANLEKSAKLDVRLALMDGDPVIVEMIEAATTLVMVSVVFEDGIPLVKGKPISEYVTEWKKTAVGKRFVASDMNGGGANPGGTGGGMDDVEACFKHRTSEQRANGKAKTWNITEQTKLKRSDPEKYNMLAKKYL